MDTLKIPSINLARLLKEGGSVSATGRVEGGFHLELEDRTEEFPLQGEAHWKVSVTAIGSGEFWLSGEVEGVALMECRRCLKPTPVPVHAYFQHLLRYQAGTKGVEFHEESEEEYYAFGEPDLGLEPFLKEAFITELPYTVLCDEGCKGLCPVCGADRNLVDCGHEVEPQNPFHVLKGLLLEL
ncbi:MAG: YceD family protein [Thermaceae bacterium]